MSYLPQRQISLTTALIISNVAIFLLGAFLPSAAVDYNTSFLLSDHERSIIFERGAFSWLTCFAEGKVWQLISYQFLHASTLHLVFNMWALYFFGPMVEEAMGQVRFLMFYLVCGIAGPLFFCLLGALGFFPTPADPALYAELRMISEVTAQPGLEYWQLVRMVGASASIYGVLIAVAYMYPNLHIRLLFPPINMSMRNFSLLVLGVAVLTVLRQGHNAGGEAGHMGGIILAAIIMSIWRWRFLRRRRNDGIF